ncbi:MAG: secondary thiamine-phosphate synthase enzyme YjbQ [Hyphomicrobiales bacterium]|nr:secondary thiamine-phosphate synthase enzyme YjbQ [Hyphomicrobiales bacterium]
MTSAIVQANHSIYVETSGPEFTDLTRDISSWLGSINAGDGLLTVFVSHTSASLTIQENADPDVLVDLTDALERFAPYDHPYRHSTEGPDDMPAHIKSMLTSTSIGIPVEAGMAVLGTWQGIYLIEHRARPHRRRVALHYVGS